MSVTLTWIGQAGFLLRTPATRLALDPFLSDHPDRRFPSPVGLDDLAGTELVLASHEHLDHLDAPALGALLERDRHTRVVVPAPAVPVAAEAGLPCDRLVAARPGDPVAAGDVTVHPVPALHGVHVADAYAHGLPGDGGYWQMANDLFDIDWDLLDERGIIVITNSVGLERSPRLTAREAAALLAGLQLASTIPGVGDTDLFAA